MKAWHFVGDKLRDGRPVPPDGDWLIHTNDVRICESGLHYSEHPFDALQYATGPVLCMVEVEDVIATEADKGVCRRRMIVKRKDITEMLRKFARQQALSVAHLWECPDIVRRYLETGDESLRKAAAEAAWARAAMSAAEAAEAAWAAARAAEAAARAAAAEAAWATAWAADAAARAAARAAREAEAEAWEAWAARAAEAEARAAAARTMFAEMVSKEFEGGGK